MADYGYASTSAKSTGEHHGARRGPKKINTPPAPRITEHHGVKSKPMMPAAGKGC